MKRDIGKVAGAIWQALNDENELAITQIPRTIDEKPPVTYQGLGWLAREGKVVYRSEGNRTFVSLTNLK